jgi:type III secretory pathway component EscT
MRELAQLLVDLLGAEELERRVTIALLVALRVAPTTILAPWIALRGSPPALRAALLALLTAALYPHAEAATPTLPSDLASLFAIGLRELALGTMIAIACALPLHALGESGRLVDVLRGAQGEASGPSGERTSPLGALQLLLGSSLFLAAGGHRLVLAAMAEGLRTMPPGSASLGESALLEIGRALTQTLTIAVAFAAPALLALVATDVSLGLVARSAPQIPIHFAGMPVRAAVGIAALALSFALLAPHLAELFAWAIGLVASF